MENNDNIFLCDCCGKEFENLPRYIMHQNPNTANGERVKLFEDYKTLVRSDSKYYVSCEIEFPFKDNAFPPLGLIIWVEISKKLYYDLLNLWKNNDDTSYFNDLASGTIANYIKLADGSFGLPVKFKVLINDPTPYIKWISEGSKLDSLIKNGVDTAFWHNFAGA